MEYLVVLILFVRYTLFGFSASSGIRWLGVTRRTGLGWSGGEPGPRNRLFNMFPMVTSYSNEPSPRKMLLGCTDNTPFWYVELHNLEKQKYIYAYRMRDPLLVIGVKMWAMGGNVRSFKYVRQMAISIWVTSTDR